MRHSNLTEGMWANDLADLVQPLLSIDEYKSKIDDTAIVIGFFIQDKEAAEDLNRFIQKSPVGFVDCEVSPAPDQRGYYVVFVELPFNDRVVPNIGSLLQEISPLVGVENWQVKCRNLDGLVQFDGDKLTQVLKVNHISDQLKMLKTKVNKMHELRAKKAHEKAEKAHEKAKMLTAKAAEKSKPEKEKPPAAKKSEPEQ